jgi:hypothetical protein
MCKCEGIFSRHEVFELHCNKKKKRFIVKDLPTPQHDVASRGFEHKY